MEESSVIFKKIHESAIIPTRSSFDSVGFDLFSIENTIVKVNENKMIRTGIIIEEFPHGTYGRIACRSGNSLKHNILIGGGVIDPDYR